MTIRLIAGLLSAVVMSGPPTTWAGATTLRVDGTIVRFDASTRILSLSTSNGTVQFPIAPPVRIRQGWHKVDPLELQKLAGYRATVRYTESAGSKTVESVHIFGKSERSE